MPKKRRRELTLIESDRRDVRRIILRLDRKYFADLGVAIPKLEPNYKIMLIPTKKEIKEMIKNLKEEVVWYD